MRGKPPFSINCKYELQVTLRVLPDVRCKCSSVFSCWFLLRECSVGIAEQQRRLRVRAGVWRLEGSMFCLVCEYGFVRSFYCQITLLLPLNRGRLWCHRAGCAPAPSNTALWRFSHWTVLLNRFVPQRVSTKQTAWRGAKQ